jgi:hypothetical protein
VTPSISVSDPPRRPTGRCLALGRGPGLWPPSAVGTLVERHSRYVLLFPLPEGVTAHQARPALTAAVPRLPEQLRRSLTWDHGRELADMSSSPSTPVSRCTSATRAALAAGHE